MPSKHNRVTLALSTAQLAMIETLASQLSDKNFTAAEAVRLILADAARQAGLNWSDDVGAWGGLRKGAFGKVDTPNS